MGYGYFRIFVFSYFHFSFFTQPSRQQCSKIHFLAGSAHTPRANTRTHTLHPGLRPISAMPKRKRRACDPQPPRGSFNEAVTFDSLHNGSSSSSKSGKKRAKKSKKKKKKSKREADKAAVLPPSPSLLSSFDPDDLNCTVCFDKPSDGVYFQCKSGHLLCSSCHTEVTEVIAPTCPTCRQPLDRDSRNRFAESVLKRLLVPCSNDGCDSRVPHAELKNHVTETCVHRTVKCHFGPLGCGWVGPFNKMGDHTKACPFPNYTPEQIRVCVLEKKEREQRESAAERARLQACSSVCASLSSPMADFALRDVVVASRGQQSFRAHGQDWSFEWVKTRDVKESKEQKVLRLKIGIERRIQRPRRARIFIISGQDSLGHSMLPHVGDYQFSDSQPSHLIEMKCKSETTPMHFRVGIVWRSGEISDVFSPHGFDARRSRSIQTLLADLRSSEDESYEDVAMTGGSHSDDVLSNEYRDDILDNDTLNDYVTQYMTTE